MEAEELTFLKRPKLRNARMILGLSGWMDGGEVSTGTIELLLDQLNVAPLAEIQPERFYLYNFPGSMELTALFRPHSKVEDGVISEYDLPTDVFYCDEAQNLILFEGKEPNTHWEEFAACIFTIVEVFNVQMVYFVGSFAGAVPHTRDPRLYTTVSDPALKETMRPHGFRFSNYEGPAGIVTHLLVEAARRNVRMASIVAEIPSYVQGRNPHCIEVTVERVSELLGLDLDLSEMRKARHTLEARLGKVIAGKQELVDMIHKLETNYDNDYLETDMGDLKKWLEEQGFSFS